MRMQNHWRFSSLMPLSGAWRARVLLVSAETTNGVSQFPSGLQDVAGYPRLFQALLEDEVTLHT